MFKVEDIERARKIVSVIELPNCFGEDEYTQEIIEDQIRDIVGSDFYVATGVSKAVIVVSDLPFVIKIPFNGTWEDNYEEDEEDSYHDYPEFCFFEDGSEYNPDNYCEDEYEKTIHVEEAGFGVLVPEMEYLCDVNGRGVYIQEKVTPLDESRRLHPSHDSLRKAEKYALSFRKEWIGLVIDTYGQGYWDRFLEWATAHEPSVISDMHSSNYGINKDGRPVMFDICGFRG